MKKEVIVQFDSEAYKEYEKLKELVASGKVAKKRPTYGQLLTSINTAIKNIKANPHHGDLIPRRYIPKKYNKVIWN